MKPDDKPKLRRSQLITTFSIGAIADLPDATGRSADASVMICGLDVQVQKRTKGWVIIKDRRLEEKLGVACFKMPPDAETQPNGLGIWAVRFPRWFRCRKCGLLMPAEYFRNNAIASNPRRNFDEQPFCYKDSMPLVPPSFVVACKSGHIDDFPFMKWVHWGSEQGSGHILSFLEKGATGTLSDIRIGCSCGVSARSMAGSFNQDTLNNVASCTGAMPWRNIWHSSCSTRIRTLQRGATNVHFPVIKSSILIPPYSQESLKAEIMNTDLWGAYKSSNLLTLEQVIPELVKLLGHTVKEIEKVARELDGQVVGEPIEKSEENYRAEEYDAFLSGTSDPSLKNDFLIDNSESRSYDIPGISQVILAKRLREIRVQTHFSRISLAGPSEEADAEEVEPVALIPVNEDRSIDWRPAYEVRGEGIFVELEHSALMKWSSQSEVIERMRHLVARSARNPDAFGIMTNLTPEFLLLHSFSHSLIRQLSFECGYSSASLRERLYCSTDQSARPMAGVLIYTAAGDADGTLGGLVRQGRKDTFPEILRQSLLSSQWCSTDPLCIDSSGQGFAALNLAACYSCSMLPETSCELLNRYLDRGTMVGTLENRTTGYFSDWIDK